MANRSKSFANEARVIRALNAKLSQLGSTVRWEQFLPLENPTHEEVFNSSMEGVAFETLVSETKDGQVTDYWEYDLLPQMGGNNARIADAISSDGELGQIKSLNSGYHYIVDGVLMKAGKAVSIELGKGRSCFEILALLFAEENNNDEVRRAEKRLARCKTRKEYESVKKQLTRLRSYEYKFNVILNWYSQNINGVELNNAIKVNLCQYAQKAERVPVSEKVAKWLTDMGLEAGSQYFELPKGFRIKLKKHNNKGNHRGGYDAYLYFDMDAIDLNERDGEGKKLYPISQLRKNA